MIAGKHFVGKITFTKGGFMKGFASVGAKYFLGVGIAGSMLLSQGCLATRDWVKEQVDQVSGRV